jgi:hypothetical protein
MRLRPWILCGVVLLLSSAAAHAQPHIVFSPAQAVTAGHVVTVGWRELPAEAEEFEFLLSTGPGELIRITPELSPSDGSFRWTIPDLPSREAVLYLRARIDDEETILASTEPFVIRGSAQRATVEFHDREWWMVTQAAPVAAPPVIHGFRQKIAVKGYVPPQDWLRHAAPIPVHARPAYAHRVSAADIDTHCGAPLVVPQRI